ncbi:retrovirus-related pol polyprotein from transposon TNT 1-94 [Tanacetum coccineum]
MAAANDVLQLVDKKGGSYAAIAPKLELPKIAEGNAKPESQLTPDERRVVVQDQLIKIIIMSCLPHDIMDSIISCVSAKETWTDLVHSFEGKSPLKVSHSLPEKWLTFSQGLRNANHTQTLDLVDINERFVYEDNLIQRRYSNTKKALITTPSSTLISTAFFSNNVIQDFQENSDDESEEYLRDLDIEHHERALLENSKRFIKRRNDFSGQKANENTKCYKCGNKADQKFQKDYKAEYKKMKAKLVILEASPSSSQNPKTFQPNNKGLVAKTFDWDEEEVSDEEEVTQDHRTSDHEMYIASLKRSENYKAQPYQYASSSKQILRAKRYIREPIWYLGSGCLRSMTGVKSYLHKYVEQPGPKVVFGDNSSCITEGYGSINCGFDDKQGTIFNANKEIVLIAPRRNDVYVLDMSSLTPNGACFFAKASKNVNWLWHKRLSRLNFKNINKLAKQNKVLAERKNRTLIEAAKTMLNGSVLSKHFWTDAVRTACYTQNRSIIVKRHDKTSYELFRERIPDISYFHVFGCPVFIHNHKDHLGKFDAKADDGYSLGYSSILKAFRVYNTRRQQIEETYHITFDESMEAIRFTNTLVDEIGIDDSFRYPPDEF